MSSQPDWSSCLSTLQSLLLAINETQSQAQQSLADGNADAFAQGCGELSRSLAAQQPLLAQWLAQDSPPADVLDLLRQIKDQLNALQEHTTRMQAQAGRALNVLIPTDQVQAYSRLGKGYGGQSRPGSAYLKA